MVSCHERVFLFLVRVLDLVRVLIFDGPCQFSLCDLKSDLTGMVCFLLRTREATFPGGVGRKFTMAPPCASQSFDCGAKRERRVTDSGR